MFEERPLDWVGRKPEMDIPSSNVYPDEVSIAKAIMDAYKDPENKDFVEHYLIQPAKLLQNSLQSGLVKGDTMLAFGSVCSPGFGLLQMFTDSFKKIILLVSSDAGFSETQKWLKKDPNAVDWSNAGNHISALKGGRNTGKDEEEKLRQRVSTVYKSDFSKINPADPVVLTPVDTMFNAFPLQSTSENSSTNAANVNQMSSGLKVGGQLVLVIPANGSNFVVKGYKIHYNIHGNGVQKKLADAGLTITNSQMYKSNSNSGSSDPNQILYIVAKKNS